MTFIPEINIEKTKANAKRKLKEYPRWRRLAGDVGEQKITATYSFEPRQPHGKQSQQVERLALDKVSAEQELERIRWTVSNLFESIHRRILFEKYLNPCRKSDLEIYTGLSMSESLYYETLGNALLAFAELYSNGVLVVEF